MGDVHRKLTPGGGQSIAMDGTLIYVKNASAPFEITFGGSERFLVQRGDKLRTGTPFTGFRIDDVGGQGVDLTLVVSDGDFSQSVIAQAVQVTNDGGQPLPVNIAGQSLPDRPYLRAKQTFSIGVQSSKGTTKTWVLVNPPNNTRKVVDPIIYTSMNRDFAFRVITACMTSENGFEHFKQPTNKNIAQKNDSNIYVMRLNELVYGSGDVRHPASDISDSICDILLVHTQKSVNGAAKLDSLHGGYSMPPGTIIAVQSEALEGDTAMSGSERTFASFDWIEQPIDA